MARWKVEVTGLRQVYDALGEMDKSAQKAITAKITDASKAVAIAASYIAPGSNPVSNWGTFFDRGRDLSYNPSTVSSSFKPRRNNFRRRGVSAGLGFTVQQTNAGGSMFEVIGSGSRVKTAAGAHLVDVVNSRFPGKQPRSLIPAYYQGVPETLKDEIADTILDAARKAGLV